MTLPNIFDRTGTIEVIELPDGTKVHAALVEDSSGADVRADFQSFKDRQWENTRTEDLENYGVAIQCPQGHMFVFNQLTTREEWDAWADDHEKH